MFYYRSAACTVTGRRGNNQDNYLIVDAFNPLEHDDASHAHCGKAADRPLFAVADGMGGESSGEKASFIAVEQLARYRELYSQIKVGGEMQMISKLAINANRLLCDTMAHNGTSRMGSTLVALSLGAKTAYVTNLGDSPAYLLRGNTLKKLTRDHTEGQVMLDAGVFTQEQFAKHPSRNRLTQHLGITPDEMELSLPNYAPMPLKTGDIFLLCSDGLCGVVPEQKLTGLLKSDISVQDKAAKLIQTAIDAKSSDNITALVVEISKKRSKHKI